jgi:hypothetical protein
MTSPQLFTEDILETWAVRITPENYDWTVAFLPPGARTNYSRFDLFDHIVIINDLRLDTIDGELVAVVRNTWTTLGDFQKRFENSELVGSRPAMYTLRKTEV